MLLKFVSFFLLASNAFCFPVEEEVENVTSSTENDKIKSLPGAAFEIKFDQYSGYLKVEEPNATKYYHYWLVESQRNPSEDPLVLWLQGGPGCSSLLGLLGENGPFRIDWKGENVLENVYAWNKIANVVYRISSNRTPGVLLFQVAFRWGSIQGGVLFKGGALFEDIRYLESPAGIGFSHAAHDQLNYTDTMVAQENHLALLAFAEKYPKFQNRSFFITGESYAGVYIPTLAVEILKDRDFPFDFKGVAIGNGFYDRILDVNRLVEFYFYRGLFGDDAMLKARKICKCSDYLNCDYSAQAEFDNDCAKSLEAMFQATIGLDPYNIYANCYVKTENEEEAFVEAKISHYIPSEYSAVIHQSRDPNHCNLTYNPLEKYLNKQEVRHALHIPNDVQEWRSCGGFTGYTMDQSENTMEPQFVTMLEAKLPMLIYHGDFDAECHFLQGQQFLRSEKFDLKLIGQRNQWNFADDIYPVAGFWDHFAQNIDFLTVRGSGHFVPSDKPREALQMIRNFIAGTRNFSLPVNVDVTPAPTSPSAGGSSTDKPSSSSKIGLSWVVILFGFYISTLVRGL